MSEAIKPKLLHNDQVQTLNEKHGWFEYRDAQSDVSRAFATDAIAEYERVRNEATAVCVETGLTPRQLVERVEELEEALQQMVEFFQPYAWGSSDNRNDALDNANAVLSKPLPTVAEVK